MESEIPLVTVTENAGLLLEGLWSLGVYEHPRREEASGKAAGAGVGAPRVCPAVLPAAGHLRQLPSPLSAACLEVTRLPGNLYFLGLGN